MQCSKKFRGRCHFCGNFALKKAKYTFKNTNRNQNTYKNSNSRNQKNQRGTSTNSTLYYVNNNANNYIPHRGARYYQKCDHCGKWGHKKENCWFLKKEQQEKKSEKAKAMQTLAQNSYLEEEMALVKEMPVMKNNNLELNEIQKDIWIADSCASSNMTNELQGLINKRKIN